jgi:predicted DNA binding protein
LEAGPWRQSSTPRRIGLRSIAPMIGLAQSACSISLA